MKKRLFALMLLVLALPAMALADQFAVVRGGRLNLRAAPSAQSASLGKYASGTWVIVGDTGGDQSAWRSVRTLNGKTGYMSANYLDFGANGRQGTVKYASGGYVNLRSGPGLTYQEMMRVTSGSTVTIVNDTSEWYYISVNVNGSAVYGYMHNSFIDRGQATTATVTTRNGGKVNVRSGPSSAYKSLGSLRSGTQVTVLLKGNGWYQISGGGLTGFMSTGYLSGTGVTYGSNTGSSGSSGSARTAWVNNPKSTQVLNLRESASQSARSIGQYRNGTQVTVVAYGSTWSEVYVGTKHGYMMSRYLTFSAPQTPVYPQPTPVYPQPTQAPLVEYITPKPQQPSQSGPAVGTPGTLAVGAGSGSTTINMYRDAALTQFKASYPAGQKMTILQYGDSVCMILIGGSEVGYVSTWNVNY